MRKIHSKTVFNGAKYKQGFTFGHFQVSNARCFAASQV